MQNSFSVVFETENVKREVHLPTVRIVSPTHMSAAGVSLEVNTDMVVFSPEEFRGTDSSILSDGVDGEILQVSHAARGVARSLSFIQVDVSPW